MSKPKIVIIGAGSLYFGRQAIWSANHLPGFKGCTLALVDTDPERLEQIGTLARMAAERSGSGVKVETWSDHREALPGADFVVLSFSSRNAHYRRIDCQVSARYGVRMCSGDTIGPGGIFRTLREFPRILEVTRDAETLCPDAWIINYVNPSAIMGIGLMRHCKAKSFALCDTHHLPHKKLAYLKMLGEGPEAISRFDCRIAGVNHFTWMLKAELDGCDVLPRLREATRAIGTTEKDGGYAKGRFNHFITAELSDVFGALPTCTGHTKEYLPFYQGRSAIQEPIPPLSVFDCDEREERTAKMWREVASYLSGEQPIEEFFKTHKADHAMEVIHTMITEDGRTYFINRANSSCTNGGKPVANLPEDAFLELECTLDRNGPKPLPVGEFPLGLRSLQTLILDLHELTIEAIMKEDRALLLRALAIDPLVNSIATAEAIIDELYVREKEALPAWVGYKETAATTAAHTNGAELQLY